VNSKERNFSKAKLRERIDRLETHIEEYLKELEENDGKETTGKEKTSAEIQGIVTELSGRKERYESYVEELERSGESQKSLTDEDSRLMAANGKMEVCYNVQTAVDGKNKLVVEFEATNEGNDKNQITPMTERTKAVLGIEAVTVVADTGYDSVQDIIESMARGATPHIAGTDFDVCVPAPESEATVPAAHHEGRCVYIAGGTWSCVRWGKRCIHLFIRKPPGKGYFITRRPVRAAPARVLRKHGDAAIRFL
jgi:hypothetical protein